jgi:hypothetical integral membrane protein (TIGR02206 family)
MVTVALIALTATMLPLVATRRLDRVGRDRVGLLIAGLLVGQEVIHMWLLTNHYARPLHSLLPLHLCGLSVLLSAWVLAMRSYRAYEIVYFWAWGGTTQALLTPDLDAGFPDPAYVAFFVGHGLVLVAVVYATWVYRFRPTPISIVRSLGALVAVAAVVAPINLVLGTNYLFLCEKPAQSSLMDYLGPWPWYVASLAGLALVSSLIYYSPFWVHDLISMHLQRVHPHPRAQARRRPRTRSRDAPPRPAEDGAAGQTSEHAGDR